eukprot:s6638_g4.t1
MAETDFTTSLLQKGIPVCPLAVRGLPLGSFGSVHATEASRCGYLEDAPALAQTACGQNLTELEDVPLLTPHALPADGICGLKWLCQLVGHPGGYMHLGETRCFAHDLRSCAWPVLRRAHRLLGSGRLLKRLPGHTECVVSALAVIPGLVHAATGVSGSSYRSLCVSVIPVLLEEMALAAFRGVALGAGRSTRLLARPLALPATKLPATFARLPMQASATRSYITVQKYSRDDVLSQLDEYHATVQSSVLANFAQPNREHRVHRILACQQGADRIVTCLGPVHSGSSTATHRVAGRAGDSWTGSIFATKLTSVVQPYLHEPEVGEKFKTVQEMMDVFYQCEDADP